MNKQVKQKWIKALRSGNYKQSIGAMYDGKTNTHCCLGVLSRLYIKEHNISGKNLTSIIDDQLGNKKAPSSYPNAKVLKWAGLHHYTCHTLANKNDHGVTFKEIAKYIEEKL